MRGVESAVVNAERGILKVQLAAQNRVRLEQVRDAIEQDGTKAVSATVRVKGEVSRDGEKWVLQPVGLPVSYEIEGKPPTAGSYLIVGEAAKLRAPIVIRATEFLKE